MRKKTQAHTAGDAGSQWLQSSKERQDRATSTTSPSTTFASMDWSDDKVADAAQLEVTPTHCRGWQDCAEITKVIGKTTMCHFDNESSDAHDGNYNSQVRDHVDAMDTGPPTAGLEETLQLQAGSEESCIRHGGALEDQRATDFTEVGNFEQCSNGGLAEDIIAAGVDTVMQGATIVADGVDTVTQGETIVEARATTTSTGIGVSQPGATMYEGDSCTRANAGDLRDLRAKQPAVTAEEDAAIAPSPSNRPPPDLPPLSQQPRTPSPRGYTTTR